MYNRVDSPTDFLFVEKRKLRAKNISATACVAQWDVVVTDTLTTAIIIMLFKDDVILRRSKCHLQKYSRMLIHPFIRTANDSGFK